MAKYTARCACGHEVTDTSLLRLSKRMWAHVGKTGLCVWVRARDIINDLAEKSKEGPL